jgi:histidinol-phosphatase (PHP family)
MDYHIHTKASPDAKGDMKDYVEKAREQRIDEIGFSDHVLLHPASRYPSLSFQSVSEYVQSFLAFREESDLPVKLGVEMDFFPDAMEKIRSFIERYPFDYVAGAVHFIGDWLIDSRSQIHEYEKRDIQRVYEEYFGLVRKLCESRLFDSLAHPDLVKIFGFRPDCDFSYILEETAESIAICVEINTAGLRRPCAEIYPSEQFLKILRSYNVPIVFGSDAHEPSDVGRNFKEAINLARRAGYTSACLFDRREKEFVRIQGGRWSAR